MAAPAGNGDDQDGNGDDQDADTKCKVMAGYGVSGPTSTDAAKPALKLVECAVDTYSPDSDAAINIEGACSTTAETCNVTAGDCKVSGQVSACEGSCLVHGLASLNGS